jgi:hypothetical protein
MIAVTMGYPSSRNAIHESQLITSTPPNPCNPTMGAVKLQFFG